MAPESASGRTWRSRRAGARKRLFPAQAAGQRRQRNFGFRLGADTSAPMVERQLLSKADVGHFRLRRSGPLRKPTLEGADRSSVRLLRRPTGAGDPFRTFDNVSRLTAIQRKLPFTHHLAIGVPGPRRGRSLGYTRSCLWMAFQSIYSTQHSLGVWRRSVS
jgi:hypothetical protein